MLVDYYINNYYWKSEEISEMRDFIYYQIFTSYSSIWSEGNDFDLPTNTHNIRFEYNHSNSFDCPRFDCYNKDVRIGKEGPIWNDNTICNTISSSNSYSSEKINNRFEILDL